MTTIIHSNGRTRGGLTLDDLPTLFTMIEEHPLDRTFERFGNFVQTDAVDVRGKPLDGIACAVSFFGNFFTYSHVFRITTDDADLVERLTAAIRANQLRPDYLDQAPPFDPDKLEINRKRFSTTQGEVELIYAGERIERYGDDITLQRDGVYRRHDDRYWYDVTRRVIEKRHAVQRARDKQKAAA
jgi:hypothetical protein